jgi:FkbM family methyltransferase
MAAKIVKDGIGIVYAFEPCVENFKLLLKNVDNMKTGNIDLKFDENKKDYSNKRDFNSNYIRLFNIGVSNKECVGKLYLNDKNSGDHRTFKTKDDNRNTVEIIFDKLDIYDILRYEPFNFCCNDANCSSNRMVDFIKIDVQGLEYKVLCGAENITSYDNINILLEYSPYLLGLAGDSPGKLIGWLLDHGFYIYQKYNGGWIYADHGFLNNKTKRFHTNLFCSRSRYEDIDWGDNE